MRVMIRMLTATYGESVSWTPMCAIGEPSGPIENGTTYIVRPFIDAAEEAGQRLAHLAGLAPVVGRPGVGLALRADEGAVLDARDVTGVGARQVGVGALRVRELLERARVDELLAEAVVLLRRPVAPVDRGRLGQLRDLFDPGPQAFVLGRGLRRALSLRCSRSSQHNLPVGETD